MRQNISWVIKASRLDLLFNTMQAVSSYDESPVEAPTISICTIQTTSHSGFGCWVIEALSLYRTSDKPHSRPI
jgi:hypothetical protein